MARKTSRGRPLSMLKSLRSFLAVHGLEIIVALFVANFCFSLVFITKKLAVPGLIDEVQPVSSLRLDLVPIGIEPSQWESILSQIGMSNIFNPKSPYIPQGKCATPKFCPQVVITVLRRWGDLYAALFSLRNYSKVAVINLDEHDSIPNDFAVFPAVKWYNARKSGHLASAWNTAIEAFQEEDYLLICNEDVIFPSDWLVRLADAMNTHKESLWIGVTQSIQFSGFLLPSKTWSTVGRFDETFTAYYEDDDYLARIQECFGPKPSFTPVLVPHMEPVVIHRRTGWHFNKGLNDNMENNKNVSKAYFNTKWTLVTSRSQCIENCCVKTRQNKLIFRRSKFAVPAKCPTRRAKVKCHRSNLPRIVDAFLFNNELDILEARLKSSSGIVDDFLLVESNVSISGNPSPLYFKENVARFMRWSRKIRYFPYLSTSNVDPWEREKLQRNHILDGLQALNLSGDDIIIITDVDEIPDWNSKVLQGYIKANWDETPIVCLGMDFYYFYDYCRRGRWNKGKMIKYRNLRGVTIESVRRRKCDFTLYPTGWHLSYFGGTKVVREKLKSFAHTEKAYLADKEIGNLMKRCINIIHPANRQMDIVLRENNPYAPLNIPTTLRYGEGP